MKDTTSMRISGRLIIIIGVLAIGGCAAYQLEPFPINHPAHPEAQPGAKPPLSTTLAYSSTDVPSARPSGANAHEGHRSATSETGRRETVVGEGNVIATVPSADQLVLDHETIEGFMDAMTMGYRVDTPSLLEGLKSGDRVRFTIDIQKKSIVKIEKLNK